MSEVRMKITGMTCQHCVAHTRKALEAVEGVRQVQVTLEPGAAIIDGTASVEDLLDAVRQAGYEAVTE